MEVLQTSALPLGYVAIMPILAYSYTTVKSVDSASRSWYHNLIRTQIRRWSAGGGKLPANLNGKIATRKPCQAVGGADIDIRAPHRCRCGDLCPMNHNDVANKEHIHDRICVKRRRQP